MNRPHEQQVASLRLPVFVDIIFLEILQPEINLIEGQRGLSECQKQLEKSGKRSRYYALYWCHEASFFILFFFPKNKKQSRLGVMHPNVSGTIKTALPGMDREVKEHYQVVIQAKDMAGQMGGLSGTTTVSITLSDVNDSPPRFANRKRLKK